MRPGFVVAAALATAAAAGTVAGSADAQAAASITVTPAAADPGAAVVVANSLASPCTPPTGATKPSASVDLYAPGSATPANRVPYLGMVAIVGSWSVEVRLAPDLAPGTYRVQAGCYTDSGLNAGYGPVYESGRIEVRQHELGPPRPSTSLGRPGDSLQITSAEAPCVPPSGASSPRVRVSLIDAALATRAESEGTVEASTGRWSVPLTVPTVETQQAQITAVCLARVGASVPYARYDMAPFFVEPVPLTLPTTVVPPPPETGPPTPSTAPGPSPTSTTVAPPTTLPMTRLAKAIVAEPIYTG